MSTTTEKPNLRRGHVKRDTHTQATAPSLSPSHPQRVPHVMPAEANNLPGSHRSDDNHRRPAPGEPFSLRAHTRDFMDGRDASDMDELTAAWAKSIPTEVVRDAVQQVGREYLRQFIVQRRSQSVRVGSPKWTQQADADPAGRLESYLLAAPGGGFICVLDCTPEQLRYNATMRRDQAAAVLDEADRLETLADATEKAKRKTPRALDAQKVFAILVRGEDDE